MHRSDNIMSDLPTLCILYGSATGNAEHIAKDLAAEAEKLLKCSGNLPQEKRWFSKVYCGECDTFKKKCSPLWEAPVTGNDEDSAKHPVIVVCSTTGNGESPENANRFVRYLKRKPTIESKPLKRVLYVTLGLGDTNYEKFCNAARMIDKQMEECGASRLQPITKADEATGLEDVVEPFKDTVLSKMEKAMLEYLYPNAVSSPSSAIEQNEEEKKEDQQSSSDVVQQAVEKKNAPLATTTVKSNESITELATKELQTKLTVSSSSSYSSPGTELMKTVAQEVFGVELTSLYDQSIDASLLPPIGPSRSSAQLLHKKDHKPSASTNTLDHDHHEDACYYTSYRPYESTILEARYLSQTSTVGAEQATKKLKEVTNSHDDDVAPLRELEVHAAASDVLSSNFDLSTKNNDKRVLELTLSLPDDNSKYPIRYQPGDAIGIVIPNKPQDVLTVTDMLKKYHNLDPLHHMVKIGNDLQCEEECSTHTLLDAIKWEMDLHTVLKPRMLCGLSQYCTAKEEAQLIQLMSCTSPQGKELYDAVVLKNQMGCGDFLRAYSSCHPTLEALLGLLSGLTPRYYSVCCSPLSSTTTSQLKVALAVVDYETPHLGRKHGLATRHLEVMASPLLSSSNPNSSNPAKLKIFPKPPAEEDEFHLPKDLSKPLILIGPGTGVAPFMGYLQHRQHKKTSKTSTDEFGSIDLFFGCRSSKHDFLYENELQQFLADGTLTKLYTAFSRDSEPKTYVQDRMREQEVSERLRTLILKHGACIYICGDGNAMARDVQNALRSILAPGLVEGCTDSSDATAFAAAERFIQTLKDERRMLLDIWM